jgi:hypothetical protein
MRKLSPVGETRCTLAVRTKDAYQALMATEYYRFLYTQVGDLADFIRIFKPLKRLSGV